jgi:hypothetical protein
MLITMGVAGGIARLCVLAGTLLTTIRRRYSINVWPLTIFAGLDVLRNAYWCNGSAAPSHLQCRRPYVRSTFSHLPRSTALMGDHRVRIKVAVTGPTPPGWA